jgi:hypothetical protein
MAMGNRDPKPNGLLPLGLIYLPKGVLMGKNPYPLGS